MKAKQYFDEKYGEGYLQNIMASNPDIIYDLMEEYATRMPTGSPIGRKLQVTGKVSGHKFKIGEVVEIVALHSYDGVYKCSNGTEEWYITKYDTILLP